MSIKNISSKSFIIPPDKWLDKHGPPYKTNWKNFTEWLKGQGYSWRDVLNLKHKRDGDFKARVILDEYLQHIQPDSTSATLRNVNDTIRSFFSENNFRIAKTRLTLIGGRDSIPGKLTSEILKRILQRAKPRDRSFLTFKFQSFQDRPTMVWINKNAWAQIKPQLDAGGWAAPDTQKTFFKDLIKIDMPKPRKRNPNPYFCFIGKEAIDSLQEYLKIRGEPKRGELIWERLSSKGSMSKMMLRLAKTIGEIPKNNPGADHSTHYGLGVHQLRDLAISIWSEHEEEKIAKFFAGHIIDPLGYRKIRDKFAAEKFKKVEPYLTILESGDLRERTIELEKTLAETKSNSAQALQIGDQHREKIQELKDEFQKRIQSLEEVLEKTGKYPKYVDSMIRKEIDELQNKFKSDFGLTTKEAEKILKGLSSSDLDMQKLENILGNRTKKFKKSKLQKILDARLWNKKRIQIMMIKEYLQPELDKKTELHIQELESKIEEITKIVKNQNKKSVSKSKKKK